MVVSSNLAQGNNYLGETFIPKQKLENSDASLHKPQIPEDK